MIMKAIVAAALLAIGVLSTVPAHAHYEGFPDWAQIALQANS
jgi:hypothetical protein